MQVILLFYYLISFWIFHAQLILSYYIPLFCWLYVLLLFKTGTVLPRKFNIYFLSRLDYYAENVTAGAALVFGKVVSNIGNAYNSKDGVFSCPENGLYIFSCTIFSTPNNLFRGDIVKNGVVMMIIDAYGISSNNYPSATGVVAISLVKGDRVWVKTTWNNNLAVPTYTSFSGWKNWDSTHNLCTHNKWFKSITIKDEN